MTTKVSTNHLKLLKNQTHAVSEQVKQKEKKELHFDLVDTGKKIFQSKAEHFFNRDLSWLEFNHRVLEQAKDPKVPLLERVRFLSIFSSNLDEFFMKRAGFLKRMLSKNRIKLGADGLHPEKALLLIRQKVKQLIKEQDNCYSKTIIPQLKQHGINLLKWKELTKNDKEKMKEYFKTKIFPVLTPLAVDPAHPFPFISNLSLSLAVKLHVPKQNQMLFARIKIPDVLPQWVLIKGDLNSLPMNFVRIQDVIEHNLNELFPEMAIESVMPFRVTRSADIEANLDDPDDISEYVEEELRRRRLADVVRLEYKGNADEWISAVLQEELELDENDLYEVNGEINYRTLNEIANLAFPEIKYKPWNPIIPPALTEEGDIFRKIQERDILVHHPYESFSSSVERFIKAAVDDPKVLAIKLTVYRTSDDTEIIPLLIRAAEQGKQVVCVVEVKARFDEAQNLIWAEKLEKAGVHVAYGLVGYKTHTKIALVVRKEGDEFNLYSHIGTGNYNSVTAKLYTDLGLFTANPKITSEIVEVFNYLTGLSLKRNYKKLLVSPINMRDRFLDMVQKEIFHKQEGKPCGIIAVMNSLEDRIMCEALYRASQAGVPIKLVIRGFCSLRPGLKGISDNIEVKSIIGRFLEHTRIYYFRNASKRNDLGDYYIGSADWMHRNLNSRVELIAPIEDKKHKKRLWKILQTMLADEKQAWILKKDGSYEKAKNFNADSLGTQESLMLQTLNIKKGE